MRARLENLIGPSVRQLNGRAAQVASLTSFESGVRPYFLSIPFLLFYFGGHAVLAFVAQSYPAFSTAWALSVLLVGLATLSKPSSFGLLVVLAGYVVGAELIWRATNAHVFWEYGKYVLILLFGLALLRRTPKRLEWRGLAFVACLVPSLAALPYFDRQDVAFNLSGPVLLGLSVIFFSGMIIDRRQLLRLSVVALGPIVGVASLATAGTLTADPRDIAVWGKATTAGFGPNQVSSILGLGLFLAFVLLVIGPRNGTIRVGFGVVAVWLGAQTILSFSRGGLWTAAGSILVATWFLVHDRKKRRALVTLSIVGFVVFRFAVFPATDKISGGIASRRATDTGLTGRDKIMQADWIIFRDHPILGVGPGQSYAAHAITFRASEAHTEYTRLLAEHGSFGVIAVFLLTWMIWDRWRRHETVLEKGVGLAFIVWTLLYMGHSAMRLAAPALMFGLGCATLVLGAADWPGRRRWVEFPPVEPTGDVR